MAKNKIAFQCSECGSQQPKWSGQCAECDAWNSLLEVSLANGKEGSRFAGYAGTAQSGIVDLDEINQAEMQRIPVGVGELDRVLGGGVVPGSVVLLGGDPGIGKSTLLLQVLTDIVQRIPGLYVTGEESLQQISLRASRLGVNAAKLRCLTETSVERLLALCEKERPQIMVVDSIQTMYTEQLQSAPGSVAQVRETAARLVRYAKQTQTAVILVGHVTKEGSLAGPRVLEHMVDAVLYFESDGGSRYRVIRAMKNRFGAVNELGVFAMTETGLREVSNPSAIFLSAQGETASGSAIMVTREGTRPLLVEVQALVDTSHLGNPRRVVVGLEQNRLAMLLAVLHRHGGVSLAGEDVFINVVGGMRISETASDLAVLLAVLSSLRDQPLPQRLVCFGEVGLSGEIRPVYNGEERLREALTHGFTHALIASANRPKKAIPGLSIVAVDSVQQALAEVQNL